MKAKSVRRSMTEWGIVVFALSALGAMADGFRNPPEGAVALGRTGGKIAHIDNATAITHNPANLVHLTAPELVVSLTLADSEIKYSSPLGPTAKTDMDPTLLPSVHAAWPMENGDWVIGLGVTSPYGQRTEWKKDSIYRYGPPYYSEVSMISISPTVATRLGERLSLGVGLNVNYSELTLRQYIPWSAFLGVPGVPDGKVNAKGDGTAVSATVGITAKLTQRQYVALTYRSPFNIDYEGDFKLNGIPAGAPDVGVARSDFESTIKYPSVVALGYGLQINEKFTVGVDVEWIEFSRYRSMTIDAGENAGYSTTIPQDWDDTWTFGVGADWALAAPWTLRAGYLYMETPIPSETMAPTLPDADRHLLSVGISYARGNSSLDLAYAYSIFDDRTIDDNINPAYNGKYELSSQLVQVSYRHQF